MPKVTDPSVLAQLNAGPVVKPADPLTPGKAVLQQQDISKGNSDVAAAPFRAREAKAQAVKAEIDAKTAQEQYDAAHKTPGKSAGLTGDALLKSLAPSQAALVKGLAEGRMAFPSGAAMRSPYWQEALGQVAQYDPTFDGTNFNARAAARRNAISGKMGVSNNALNTAIGHAGLLMSQVPGTFSGPVSPLNAIGNFASQHLFGQPGVPTYNDTVGSPGTELEFAL